MYKYIKQHQGRVRYFLYSTLFTNVELKLVRIPICDQLSCKLKMCLKILLQLYLTGEKC